MYMFDNVGITSKNLLTKRGLGHAILGNSVTYKLVLQQCDAP